MGFWETVLPGYKGYRQREDSRNTDKLLREFLTERLREGRDLFDDIKASLAANQKLSLLNPAEDVTQTLSKVTDRLRYANYGFSGKWFGKGKIDRERLERVHAADQRLAERVTDLLNRLHGLGDIGDEQACKTAFTELTRALKDMNEALNEREQILRDYGGQPEQEQQ
jgi:hypothetical protein